MEKVKKASQLIKEAFEKGYTYNDLQKLGMYYSTIQKLLKDERIKVSTYNLYVKKLKGLLALSEKPEVDYAAVWKHAIKAIVVKYSWFNKDTWVLNEVYKEDGLIKLKYVSFSGSYLIMNFGSRFENLLISIYGDHIKFGERIQ